MGRVMNRWSKTTVVTGIWDGDAPGYCCYALQAAYRARSRKSIDTIRKAWQKQKKVKNIMMSFRHAFLYSTIGSVLSVLHRAIKSPPTGTKRNGRTYAPAKGMELDVYIYYILYAAFGDKDDFYCKVE